VSPRGGGGGPWKVGRWGRGGGVGAKFVVGNEILGHLLRYTTSSRQTTHLLKSDFVFRKLKIRNLREMNSLFRV